MVYHVHRTMGSGVGHIIGVVTSVTTATSTTTTTPPIIHRHTRVIVCVWLWACSVSCVWLVIRLPTQGLHVVRQGLCVVIGLPCQDLYVVRQGLCQYRFQAAMSRFVGLCCWTSGYHAKVFVWVGYQATMSRYVYGWLSGCRVKVCAWL